MTQAGNRPLKNWAVACFGLASLCVPMPALASPWAEVGDEGLRSDIEILANARLVSGITSQWPIAWNGLTNSLASASLRGQPAYVLDAARRIRQEAATGTEAGLQFSAGLDLTNLPSLVRGFDALGREEAQAQMAMQYNGATTSLRLSVGVQTSDRHDHQSLVLDGSYLSQKLGNTIVYAGYLPHWWGPGWMSAMSLSNNARPFPHIGIMRSDPHAFSWPVLRWLGSWQVEFFAGVLDGNRINRNTVYDGLRLSVNPLPGLEIGVARTNEVCGTGHPCQPIAEWFHFSNYGTHQNQINDEGLIDIHYSGKAWGIPFSLYAQEMNEVESNPLPQSVSHLYGLTAWSPAGGGMGRLTLEWASSIPTYQLFWGHPDHGFAYNNGGYPDGMRYRGRSLGFSLDSDSQLLSLSADWRDGRGMDYRLTFHHADVSNPLIGSYNAAFFNAVTTSPVRINMLEARLTAPFRDLTVDLAARVQDDQPRPDRGAAAGVELSLRRRF